MKIDELKIKLKNISLIVMTAVFLCGFLLWTLLKHTNSESVSERRPLVAFPAVTCEAFSSGSFMENFEKYTLD